MTEPKFKIGDVVWIDVGESESRWSGEIIKVFLSGELRGYNMVWYIVDCNLIVDWHPFLKPEMGVYATEHEPHFFVVNKKGI